jgi:hypothetical protein
MNRSPNDFLFLFYAKCPSYFRNAPGRLSQQNKKFYPQKLVFGAQTACGDVTSLSIPFFLPTYLPTHLPSFIPSFLSSFITCATVGELRQAIQQPIFSVAYTDFEGGGDGRVAACGTFLVR